MSTNLFPYKYLKGQWYQADEINDSDVVVVVDTSQETIWFQAGNKSTARNRSDARALLGDLMEKYTSYEFKRVSNETPDDILVKLDDLKELYYVRSVGSLNYDLRKVSSIYFYLNSIGCLLLIISISFLGSLIFGSGTSFIDSHLHYSILFDNFIFQISFYIIKLITWFSLTINLDQLDEETKKKFQNLTQLGQSLELLTQQKLQIDSTIRETEIALEELEKASPDTVVYKQIGGILVKSERNKLLDEKKSDKETLNMRSNTLAQKIERTKSSFENMQKSLQADIQNQ